MDVVIPIFDRLTVLDAVGPYEVLSRLPGATVHWVAAQKGPVRADAGLALVADRSLAELSRELPRPEVIVVPGGFGTRALLSDEKLLDWLRQAHETSLWTTSVCTGSLVLGAAGLLRGLRATTHWSQLEQLSAFGAKPVQERVVREGRIVTAAGVSAGIDMALQLAAWIAGEGVARAIQLGIEYDPEPPFDAGTVSKAGPEIVALVRGRMAQEEAS